MSTSAGSGATSGSDSASSADRPIGIFDSGVGGLTVARTIVDQLPAESIIYIGDTAHAPYGPKTAAEVQRYSQAVADELVARGCKMIVVACNTASSVFLEPAAARYDVPVLGVIEPAARRAVAATRNGKIGVIGTTGTIRSGAYQKTLHDLDPAVEVHAVDCPQFVPFVERGITTGRQILGLTEAYMAGLQEAGVDTVVLGCTHYPLLTGVIQLAMGDRVTLVNSAEETAKDVQKVLYRRNELAGMQSGDSAGISGGDQLAGAWVTVADRSGEDALEPYDESVVNEFSLPEPTRRFESTGDPQTFARLARRFLGPAITNVSHVEGDWAV